MRFAYIICFALFPWLMALVVNTAAPYSSNDQIELFESANIEPLVKHRLFIKRPTVDTIVCGDSRSGTLAPASFIKRGWSFFNWSLSGLCPGDTVMQMNYSLLNGAVKRAIIGVSFENMALPNALSCSRYTDSVPFNDKKINDRYEAKTVPVTAGVLGEFKSVVKSIRSAISLTAAKAHARSRFKYFLYAYITHQQFDLVMDEYGNYLYAKIREDIKNRTFDYSANRDPVAYFNREDSESAYLRNKKLSVEAMAIMSGLLRELRKRKIKTVVYETVKLPAYQALIDGDPLLNKLQAEWREFYKRETHGGVVFLEAKDVYGCYHFDEFFDAAHFLGDKTETQLSEKLASSLERL